MWRNPALSRFLFFNLELTPPTSYSNAMSSNHASLDAASTDRKSRLAKLAALKRKQPEPESLSEARAGDEEAGDAAPDVTTSYLSGRNYDAETRGPKLGFEQGPQDGEVTVETQAAEIAQATAEQARKNEEADQPIDLFKLQPKKPNWDLRRDLDEKLKTLDVRTQNAIARLVRQRIENAQRAAKERGGQSNGDQGEEVGIEGDALVEGIHLREREETRDEEMI
jgi:coiled-coil domain-containing protein 12